MHLAVNANQYIYMHLAIKELKILLLFVTLLTCTWRSFSSWIIPKQVGMGFASYVQILMQLLIFVHAHKLITCTIFLIYNLNGLLKNSILNI